MKTIAKTLIAASIIMLCFSGYSANNPIPSTTKKITYVVNIIPSQHRIDAPLELFVGIAGDNGKTVGGVQKVQKGTFTYEFFENGPVKGTREAFLINRSTLPSDYIFYCAPAILEGKFDSGETYVFNLYPVVTRFK
jgi:hypothetical protein